ncbi:complex I subunit 5 family protein [Millisia brevis]|uniref:complex I subunit 5 family protein n=1 Tax=Millisia brevis TaxID=264148 RepID=UPI0008320D04|nr:proton-conducting transporter membrane subunit [Millisia brevis]
MIASAELIAVVVFAPLIGAMVAAPLRGRAAITAAAATSAVTALATVVLIVAIARTGPLALDLGGWNPIPADAGPDPVPLGIRLRVDEFSAVMLGLTALIGVAATWYASGMDKVRGHDGYWPLWLGLWAALNGVYVSGDLFNLYVCLELMGLCAVGMVALGGRRAHGPALTYLYVAVVGSLLYLLAVALIYAQTESLDIAFAATRLESGPVAAVALGLVATGMAFKTALFPLHSWLPTAHSAAPSAVSPVLSALVVKASIYILMRLWFELFPTAPEIPLQLVLGCLGSAAVVWGAIMAFQQTHLKRVVAYSTVAQVGYFFLVFALLEPGSATAAAAWTGAIVLLLSHGIAKAAMFFAAGNLAAGYGSDRTAGMVGAVTRMPLSVGAFAVAGVSIAGLPPTFGFIGKWQLLQAAFGTGQWWWAIVLILGGLLTFGYTALAVGATFNRDDAAEIPEPRPVPKRMQIIAMSLAALSVILGVTAYPLLEFVARATPGGGG